MPSLLKLRNKFEGVPGGFKMFCKETSKWIGPMNDWWAYEKAVKDHYVANNIPIGLLFSEQIEHEACKNTELLMCTGDLKDVKRLPYFSLDWNHIVTALKTLLSYATSKEKVLPEESERRAAICVTCEYNITGAQCSVCSAGEYIGLLSGYVGAYKTKHDKSLGVCKVCGGCSLKVKALVPTSVIHAYEDPTLQEFYPDYCWIKNPIVNE